MTSYRVKLKVNGVPNRMNVDIREIEMIVEGNQDKQEVAERARLALFGWQQSSKVDIVSVEELPESR